MVSKANPLHFGIITGCLAASAIAFYFGTGVRPIWWLTWLTPIPLLLIVVRISLWQAFGCSVLVSFAGALNLWHYLHRVLGIPLVATAIVMLIPALIFAAGVLFFRRCVQRGALLRAAISFPVFWVSYEFLTASFSLHGTAGNLGYSQMNFLPLVQIASITGIWGMSFCVLLFSTAIAAISVIPGQHPRKKVLAGAAGITLLGMFGFGEWRLHSTQTGAHATVALIASDLPENNLPTTEEDSLRLFREYAAHAGALSTQRVQAIVLPEKIAVVRPAYLPQVDALFSASASRTGATVVVGMIRRDETGLLNEARIYSPDGAAPVSYEKHHMLPAFESEFVVGKSRLMIPQTSGLWGITICKDMDFTQLSRQYGMEGAGLLLVPAWDFDLDGWWHGRMAILRGVESGFSIARAPRHGVLTISDDHGRVLAERATDAEPFVSMVAQVPVQHHSTLYSRWGDWFAWVCVLLLVGSFVSTMGWVALRRSEEL